MNELQAILGYMIGKDNRKTLKPSYAKEMRISVYFDYEADNHHISLAPGASKDDVIFALHELIKIIELSK
jgi:hypothetical protein